MEHYTLDFCQRLLRAKDLIDKLDQRTNVLFCATIEAEQIVALEVCLAPFAPLRRRTEDWKRCEALSFPELLTVGETSAKDQWWHMLLIARHLKDRREYDRYSVHETTIADVREDMERMYDFRQIRLRRLLASSLAARA